MRSPLATLALIGVLVTPGAARAESQASPRGKGIVGVALLGAEAVTLTEAALGVRPGWAYLVGGLAGAAGGGVGGYFVEDGSARLNVYLLAAGMALVIPTTVAILSATAYQPPADYTEDRGPIDEPSDEAPEPDFGDEAAHTPAHRGRHIAAAPLVGLVGYRDQWSLSVPAVTIGNAYTDRERATFGVRQRTEVQVPVLDVHF